MIYRNEIDGLRAIAILSVIFFHADFTFFRGGFVGVDVFFVISGYLIANIILSEIKQGSFSLLVFYERRARRIIPALFFVILCTLPFIWSLMLPSDLKNFSLSLIATALFASNVFFWLSSGYFDTSSYLKPLIHTWSIAVEVQFYIIFPFILIFFLKFARKFIFLFFLLLAIISLVVAQWSSKSYPYFNFYLLPTRLFEIISGVLICFFIPNKYNLALTSKSDFYKKLTDQSLSIFGLVLVIYSIIKFDKEVPLPSLYTLVPIIGTVLVIVFANNKTLVGKILSNKLFSGIGLISYSAYLWHQPIFAIARYQSYDGRLTSKFILIILIIIFFLAFLSWKYIEKPFRARKVVTSKMFILFTILGSVIFILIGFYGYYTKKTELNFFENQKKVIVNEKIMLLGDSHAGAIAFGLKNIYGEKLIEAIFPGCIPFYNIDRHEFRNKPGECVKQINQKLKDFELDKTYRLIILSSMGPVYLDNTVFKQKNLSRINQQRLELVDNKFEKDSWIIFEIAMRNTLTKLSLIPNKKIIYILDVPELGIESRHCGYSNDFFTLFGTRFTMSRNNLPETCRYPRSEFDKRVDRYHKLVNKILKDFDNVILFDPTSLFCDEKWCYGIIDGRKLYIDEDHLSELGSIYLAKSLSPLILNVLK